MALFTGTQQQYYAGNKRSFTHDGIQIIYTIANDPSAFPVGTSNTDINVYFDGVLQQPTYFPHAPPQTNYLFTWNLTSGWHLLFLPGPYYPAAGVIIEIEYAHTNFGGYQFTSLEHIINQFMFAYVGEDKIISKTKRLDVAFHAQRAMQELSFDTFKSCKAQEIEVPATLTMILPHDYVNYVKITWTDSAGIEHVLYPASKTSNPFNIKQDADGNYSFDIDDDTTPQVGDRDDTTDLIPGSESDTWGKYKSSTPSENQDDYQDDTYWPAEGGRYGLDPQHAQVNGSYFIDCAKGVIHFSSNLSGKTIILKYVSDSLGKDDEMVVHKFAEEAIYKWVAYAVLSTKVNMPEHIIQRYKKERFAETRKAKLRLSNLKIEELTQVLRGQSKHIKH